MPEDAKNINPVGDVLFGVTLAYTALVLELIESGALQQGAIVARLGDFTEIAKANGTLRAASWIGEVRGFIASGRNTDG